MKNPFKPGDRVRVYTGNGVFNSTVVYICADQDCLIVQADSGQRDIGAVHFRQCRRLVKKKRKEIWVDTGRIVTCGLSEPSYLPASHEPFPGATKFREVKE